MKTNHQSYTLKPHFHYRHFVCKRTFISAAIHIWSDRSDANLLPGFAHGIHVRDAKGFRFVEAAVPIPHHNIPVVTDAMRRTFNSGSPIYHCLLPLIVESEKSDKVIPCFNLAL